MPYSTPPGEEDLQYVSTELPDPKCLGGESRLTRSLITLRSLLGGPKNAATIVKRLHIHFQISLLQTLRRIAGMRQTLDCVLFQLTPTKGPLEQASASFLQLTWFLGSFPEFDTTPLQPSNDLCLRRSPSRSLLNPWLAP